MPLLGLSARRVARRLLDSAPDGGRAGPDARSGAPSRRRVESLRQRKRHRRASAATEGALGSPSIDVESGELPGRRRARHLDSSHTCRRWAGAAPDDELLETRFVPFGDDLDGSVVQVPSIARQAERARSSPRRSAIENPLHPADDAQLDSGRRHRFNAALRRARRRRQGLAGARRRSRGIPSEPRRCARRAVAP